MDVSTIRLFLRAGGSGLSSRIPFCIFTRCKVRGCVGGPITGKIILHEGKNVKLGKRIGSFSLHGAGGMVTNLDLERVDEKNDVRDDSHVFNFISNSMTGHYIEKGPVRFIGQPDPDICKDIKAIKVNIPLITAMEASEIKEYGYNPCTMRNFGLLAIIIFMFLLSHILYLTGVNM